MVYRVPVKLSDLGEFGVIDSIKRSSAGSSPSVVAGIGDDAAAVVTSSSKLLLATTDMLLEGVHFDLSLTDAFSLGWKAVAVNVSDIAAMGGVPRFCLTSIGIPAQTSTTFISEFYRGCNALLRQQDMTLVGGDTCASRQGLIISITVLGETERKRLLTRSGAAPGHRIFVTGTPGDSAAGLELLVSRNRKSSRRGNRAGGADRSQDACLSSLVDKHLRPTPRTNWGRAIAIAGCASSMIDISDGISSDLGHICEESGVGALIQSGNIPLSGALRKVEHLMNREGLEYALSGGEDYELLFTVPPDKIRKLNALDVPATDIGEIIKTKTMQIVDRSGVKRKLRISGYDHFGKSGPRS